MAGRMILSARWPIAAIAMTFMVVDHGIAAADELTAVKLDDHAHRLWDVAVSSDGNYAASVGDGELIEHRNGSTTSQGVLSIWDTNRRKLIVSTSLDNYQLLTVTFLPGGDRLAVAGWNGLYLVQARDGRVLRTFKAAKAPIHAVAVSRDGSMLASAGLESVQIWNVNTGEQLKFAKHEFGFKKSINLTRDGRLLFAGSEQSTTAAEPTYFVRLWDIGREARDLRFGFPAPMAYYRDIAMSSDERRVLTLSSDGNIEEWDMQSARRVREWKDDRGVKLMAVSGHARALATVSHEGQVTIWDIAAARPVGTYQLATRHCEWLAVSDDGQHIVAGTVENDVWLISRSDSIPTANAASPNSTPAASLNRAPSGLFPINPLPR